MFSISEIAGAFKNKPEKQWKFSMFCISVFVPERKDDNRLCPSSSLFMEELRIPFLGHDQVHDDGGKENNGNTVLGKNGANQSGENVEHIRDLGKA